MRNLFENMPKGQGHSSANPPPPYMTKEEMIKWFLDNLKPPYYENMINVQVPYFANLISIGEPVDEGIISKKTIDLTTLYSLMEQQFKESETKVSNERSI